MSSQHFKESVASITCPKSMKQYGNKCRLSPVRQTVWQAGVLKNPGYPGSSGFASVRELCLMNSSSLQKCGILDGHASYVLLHQHSRVRCGGCKIHAPSQERGGPKTSKAMAPLHYTANIPKFRQGKISPPSPLIPQAPSALGAGNLLMGAGYPPDGLAERFQT